MKIAQYELEDEGCVAVEVQGKWINYSKAFVSYHFLEHGLTLRQPQTVTEMLQLGLLDVKAMKKVVAHVTKNRLQKYFSLPDRSAEGSDSAATENCCARVELRSACERRKLRRSERADYFRQSGLVCCWSGRNDSHPSRSWTDGS